MKTATKVEKLLAMFLILAVFGSLAVAPACAENPAAVTVGSADALASTTAEIAVSVSGMNNICVAQFAVEYDADKLELVSAVKGSAVPTDADINTNVVGSIYFAWDSTSSTLSESGTILVMQFRVKENSSGEAFVRISESEERLFSSYNAGYYNQITPEYSAGKVSIAASAPALTGKISGLGASLADATDLKIFVKDVTEGVVPQFSVTLADRTLSQAADDTAYALSNDAVYTVKWDASNSRWVIRIKVFPKVITSAFTLSATDAEGNPLELTGYEYEGVGSREPAQAHAYSFLDYLHIMSIWKGGQYTTLYNQMQAYGDLMKNWT